MSANFEAKKVVVQEITEKIKASKSVILVDYNKLTVAEVSALRNKCKQAGCEYKVYKNTLVRKALNDLGHSDFDSDLNGPTAVAFGPDETSAAKVMQTAAKDYEGKIVIKSAFVELLRPCLREKNLSRRCSALCRHPCPTLPEYSTISLQVSSECLAQLQSRRTNINTVKVTAGVA